MFDSTQHGHGAVEQHWNRLYTLAGYSTIVALLGIVIDLVIGFSTGGNVAALPQTAVGRFAQFQEDWFMGLYTLDLLNVLNQILLIPAYVALFVLHRADKGGYSLLVLILFLIGTTLFIANNAALPMLELSNRYIAATTESQKTLLAAAGEGMLAKGVHGSLGAFIGFVLPNIAGLFMSFVMLKGKIFSRATAYAGIFGSIFIVIYIVLVTFVPAVKSMATMFAAPGGLLLMAWMVMFTIRFFQLGAQKNF